MDAEGDLQSQADVGVVEVQPDDLADLVQPVEDRVAVDGKYQVSRPRYAPVIALDAGSDAAFGPASASSVATSSSRDGVSLPRQERSAFTSLDVS
jgi:hypothetical protein